MIEPVPCPEQIDPISTARCGDVVEITRLLNCVLSDAIFGIVLIDCMCFFGWNRVCLNGTTSRLENREIHFKQRAKRVVLLCK